MRIALGSLVAATTASVGLGSAMGSIAAATPANVGLGFAMGSSLVAAANVGSRQGQAPEEVDVLIVGGGASGSHAAVRIREDFKKSVLLVEKSNKLGGHVHTYVPEGGGEAFDFGVQYYLNRPTAKDFFKRFDIDLVEPPFKKLIDRLLKLKDIDFKTGRDVHVDYPGPDLIQAPADVLKYLDIAKKYQPWFEGGYWQTGDVPSDLLLSFGDFLQKYDLGSAMRILRVLISFGDALSLPTFYVMAIMGSPQVAAFGLGLAGPTFKRPSTGRAQSLYDKIQDLLGRDVVLESTLVSSQRTDDGVTATIQTPTGQRTVKAKRLLIAATPSPDNVAPWDLNDEEKTLFNKFQWETLYVAVVKDLGLPEGAAGFRNAPNDLGRYFIPTAPYCDAYDRQAQKADLYGVQVVGPDGYTQEEARSLVMSQLKNIDQAGEFHIADSASIAAFASHGAAVPRVTADELKAGFYQKLYALQGKRSTFHTGLTWAPDHTATLWEFNEKILPQIVNGI